VSPQHPRGLVIGKCEPTDDMNSLPAPSKNRAKTARDAFRLLLQRTERRVKGGTRSPATLAMQREHARYLLEHIGARTPVDQLTPRRIAKLLEKEGRGRRRPLSGNTLRKRASTLSQALELARGRAPKLPEIPFRYRPQVNYLQDLAAYERLRDALTPAQRLWFVVAVWTGQRCSDVDRMEKEDFDPHVPFVTVRSTKTGQRAGVRIHASAELVRELREHWLQLPAGAKLVPAWPHANTTLRRICAKLEMPKLSTKGLRHTFFTWYVAANGFTAELLAIGGWKDLTMPARVYAHALPVRFRSQIDRTFAVAKSLRLGPQKSLAKAKAGPTSSRNGATERGAGEVAASPAPVTRPEGLVHGTGLNARPPDAQRQRSEQPVGPAGIEPATNGLKVRRITSPFEAETPSEGLCAAPTPPATLMEFRSPATPKTS
jgi:integrase